MENKNGANQQDDPYGGSKYVFFFLSNGEFGFQVSICV